MDDHAFFRSGVRMALQRMKFLEFHFEAIDGPDFLSKQQANPGDIVLLDADLPKMNGYQVVQQSKSLFPRLKIIMLTVLDDDDEIRKYMDAGIDGFLTKNIDSSILEAALKSVIEGQKYYSSELMLYFMRHLNAVSNGTKMSSKLTSRELEILQLIFDGLSNSDIADKLFISLRTVTNHRYRLKQKTGAKNTAGLIAYGLKHDLLR